MERPRKQTYTLSMYLQKMKDLDIRSDQRVQRLSGQWNNSMVNELVYSVLNGEYIPPIILGQEASSQLYVVDGLQRSTSLMMFRYGNYRITSSLEEPIISYRAKVMDSEGNPKIDGNGDLCWETKTFDLRRKTFDKLPDELKKVFNEFQLDCIIHENYTQDQISRLVRRYNNLKSMTVSQKAFTFCDVHARRIREILKRKFFIEAPYTKAERKNGTVERVLMETIMCTNHLDNWKKSSQIGAYLNDNATPEEFDILENCISRLEDIITDDLYPMFTSKDSFLWFSLFHKFADLGLPDVKFADFLNVFKNELYNKEVNGKIFSEIDKKRSTKDKTVIAEKLDLLVTLMHEFLGISKAESEPEEDSEELLEFISTNVNPDVTEEDIELYKDMLNDFAELTGRHSKLLDRNNQAALIAIIAYACRKDIKLDEWFVDYFNENDEFIPDQLENYEYMKSDLQQFLELKNVA